MNAQFREKFHIKFDLEPGESLAEALIGVSQITKSAASIQLTNMQPEMIEAQQLLLEAKQQINESRKLIGVRQSQ